ncbi:peptidyl-prolyl cis-trans isomerase [Qipengyuania sp. DGS5-3]|uniref:peptidyl-prolyl cis-trans isomerase n=1 Tax=Qipengyuania sp. DGS5-3 TaxID=3349632 RepID=UPI0036D38E59
MSAIHRALRDPLVHFLIAGAALFAFFAWRGTEVDPASRSITVTREAQAGLSLQFERAIQRPPTDAELDGLVDRWVRDEVLYREAIRLGLDQEDAVVRRRLAQKMDGLAGAEAETERPSEATLDAWLAENPERFAADVSYSFDQLWFDSEEAANAGLEAAQGGAAWQQLGREISLPASAENVAKRSLEAQFGEEFIAGLSELEPANGWSGPITSGFGWHVVRLRERTLGDVPPLDEIRGRVEDDWRTVTIAERRERGYQVLRDAYDVTVEE